MDRHDVPAAALKPKRSPARRCVSAAFWLLYVAVLLEVVARGYWAYFCDVPFFDSSQVLVGRFYPELNTSGVLTESITRDDEYFDVLLLGGSVLTDEYGTIEANLRKRLGQLTEHRVRVFNLAACGHTSRDSLIKYRMLDEQKFDLVVVYETINETRLNNCPPEMFRADYTHASWYDRIERLKTHPELRYCVFPYTLEYTAVGVLEARCFGRYIPRHAPDDHLWYEYGADVKTAATFRANVEEIVALARQRGAQVLLPTYAAYIPSDYSNERMNAHDLDYGRHCTPIEIWGSVEGVSAGVAAHNAVARDVARSNTNVILVDLDREMPRSKQTFDDVCHLTPDGCELWVASMDEPLRRRMTGVVVARRLPTPAERTVRVNAGDTKLR